MTTTGSSETVADLTVDLSTAIAAAAAHAAAAGAHSAAVEAAKAVVLAKLTEVIEQAAIARANARAATNAAAGIAADAEAAVVAAAAATSASAAATVAAELVGEAAPAVAADRAATEAARDLAIAAANAAAASAAAAQTFDPSDYYGKVAADARYQPIDDVLSALSALVLAADKLIYATGANTFEAMDFNAWARDFLAAATAGAGLTALGVGNFAQSLFDDADAAEARVTLGVTVGVPLDVGMGVGARTLVIAMSGSASDMGIFSTSTTQFPVLTGGGVTGSGLSVSGTWRNVSGRQVLIGEAGMAERIA